MGFPNHEDGAFGDPSSLSSHLNRPLDYILSSIDQIQTQEIKIADQWVPVLPTHLREDQDIILKALKIELPKTIRHAT